MKIKRDRLIEIIKEELDDYQMKMAADDPEEFLSTMKSKGSIEEIDAEIAKLHARIKNLMAQREQILVNIESGEFTFDQVSRRSPNE